MMKYISVTTWRDLGDGHLYHTGDPFPCDGREISAERIEALTSTQNKAGFALIRAVEEPDKENIKDNETTAEIAGETAEKAVAEKKPTTARKPRATKAK